MGVRVVCQIFLHGATLWLTHSSMVLCVTEMGEILSIP